MTTLLAPFQTQLMYVYIMLVHNSSPQAAAPKIRCEWSRDIIPGLDRIVGNVMGLALSVGQLAFFVSLALLIVLVATKYGGVLLKTVVGIVFFALLINTGWLPIDSPC